MVTNGSALKGQILFYVDKVRTWSRRQGSTRVEEENRHQHGERLNIQTEVAGKIGISHGHLSKIERVYGSEEKIPDVVKKLDEGRVR